MHQNKTDTSTFVIDTFKRKPLNKYFKIDSLKRNFN